MTTAVRVKKLACLALVATLMAGCAGPKEPTRVDMEIPSGGVELEAWATKVAKDNEIKMDYSASTVARTICSDVIPKHKDLDGVLLEVAKFRGVDLLEAGDLIAIAIYGYCPQYTSRWESDPTFKKVEVRGVTPLIWH